MNYLTLQLLSTDELKILRKNLDNKELPWEDGKQTAGEHAAKVKNNLQLNRNTEVSKKNSQLITPRHYIYLCHLKK